LLFYFGLQVRPILLDSILFAITFLLLLLLWFLLFNHYLYKDDVLITHKLFNELLFEGVLSIVQCVVDRDLKLPFKPEFLLE
jgi:hypothetical protein